MNLSVIVAAYNVEKFIEKCINSCSNKSLIDQYEIIVVNDGSEDGTLEILKCLISTVPNLKIINKKNEGLGAARNTGIINALGKYIWMIDGDDYLEDGALDMVLNNIKNCHHCYIINYNVVKESGEFLYTKYPPAYISTPMTGSHYYNINYENSYTWQYIFKKDLFAQNNIKFQERINMQDSEILPKIMYYVNTVFYIDYVGYNYVQQNTSFTNSSDSIKRFRYFESIIAVNNSLIHFAEQIKNQDPLLYEGILKKIKSVNDIVFNHLIYYKYSENTFKSILELLKKNSLYPLKNSPSGKFLLLKILLNLFPLFTKKIIDLKK